MLSYYQRINDFVDQAYDDRQSHLPLMGSIYKIGIIIAVYLLFVKKLGPEFMKNRKPYNLSSIMPYYNAFQVISNAWCSFYFLKAYFDLSDEWHNCPMPNTSDTELDKRVIFYSYIYYLLKVLDLVDTVFIILKKNDRQASVLHIYHHTIMALGAYIHTQYYAGGAYGVPAMLNTMVHVCMYSYFFMTTIRPAMKQSIWWKKHITHVQIIQFVICIRHFVKVVFNSNCKYSKFWSWFGLSQNITFLCLFINFYVRNYLFIKTKEKK